MEGRYLSFPFHHNAVDISAGVGYNNARMNNPNGGAWPWRPGGDPITLL